MKTIYVTKDRYEELGLERFGNAGPNPCISGMKRNHWGLNALCVKCGQYIYLVDKETYIKAGGNL